jgi:GMP synthase-like glutamine amidotransferase
MTQLNVQVIQHVPFEGSGVIGEWMIDRGHKLATTKLYQGDVLPELDEFDWLVVMGGPMGVYDSGQYSWITDEQHFIQNAINAGKGVLGICLGAQFIAAALGMRVFKNEFREIGWFDLTRSQQIADTVLADCWPETVNVFHWHGDTFDLPKGAQRIAASEACKNQGFILNNRVVGFQFHMEVTNDSISALIENCGDELDGSSYVQSENELKATDPAEVNQLMVSVLECLEKELGIY